MKLAIPLIFLTVNSYADPIALGSRWELFVDEFLIAEKTNLALKLHDPIQKEIVLTTDQPWEGPTCAFFTAIQDGKKVRLYYRGSSDGAMHSDDQVACMAESTDGIHFTRPNLGLIEVGGTKDNNVIWKGSESHNFSPFLDANPAAKPEERYKALGGVKEPGKNWDQGKTPGGLYAFASADGVNWKKMRDTPVITKGAFDSQNIAFYDTTRSRYACFSRIFTGDKLRAIQSSTSVDFLTWSEGVAHRYAEGTPTQHLYTSATVPCPTAPHLFLSFPMRFKPARLKVPGHQPNGVSDAIFMSSRDGVNWDRSLLEAWVRPGPDLKNWTDRNNMPANGIVESSEVEWSLYISEHYRHADHGIRRLSVRKQGFASMHADAKGGQFITRSLTFSGRRLLINYSTSAVGFVQIDALDDAGNVLATMPEVFGDEFAAETLDLGSLNGKAIRLRVKMKDADLYALRFAD